MLNSKKILESRIFAFAIWFVFKYQVLCFSQNSPNFIYSDSIFGIFLPESTLAALRPLDQCNDSVIVVSNEIFSSFDILVRPNGDVYGYGIRNGFFDKRFYRINLITGIAPISNASYLTLDTLAMGLTCDENGYLYLAGKGITKQTMLCCNYEEQYLGDLPPNMQCQGDITYRRGKFYLAAVGNKLVEVNMKSPGLSQIVMEFPPGTLPIHGLATVQLGCDSVATYAIGREQAFSKVYEIDFDTWTVTEVCEVPRSVTGAGAQTECMLPPCDIFVDLDNDNSSFGFWGNYCADTFCVPPVAVADTDVVILSASEHLDSLVLELGLVLDMGQEYLQFAPSGNVGVMGNNSTYLTLTNNGSATIADFEAALKAVQYFNDALPLTFGKRMVSVRAWSGGVESIVSAAELPLSNELLHLQADISLPSCFGFSDGSVQMNTVGGFPPYNYQWGTGQLGSLVSSLPAGSYPLTVTDSLGCSKMDTVLLVQPSLLTASIANNGLPTICNDSGVLQGNAQGGTPPYTFNWDNGAVGSSNSGIGPGSYLLTVSDSNGCQAMATYTIASGDTVLVSQQEEICEGETFAWGGGLFASDTLLCLTYTLPGGCDSTVCLALAVIPLPQPAIAIAGDFCTSDEVGLSTGLFSTYLWSNGETSQQIAVASAGAFAVTVSNIYGCTAAATVTVPAGVEFSVAASPPTCFGDKNGSIQVENVNGGTPPWAYSINGVDFVPGGSFEGLAEGNYTLWVVDADGCQTSAEVLLESPHPFFVDAGNDQFIQLGEGIVLNASTNFLSPIVLWQPPDHLLCPDCLTTAAHPLQSTQYQVLVTDENGCTASDEVWVEVAAGGQIYVPNAFTPNGDRINDHLGVFADASIADILSFQVFDRWGGLVYNGVGARPNMPESGWDGQSKGKNAADGVYVYRLELLKVDGTRLQMSGEVILLR